MISIEIKKGNLSLSEESFSGQNLNFPTLLVLIKLKRYNTLAVLKKSSEAVEICQTKTVIKIKKTRENWTTYTIFLEVSNTKTCWCL